MSKASPAQQVQNIPANLLLPCFYPLQLLEAILPSCLGISVLLDSCFSPSPHSVCQHILQNVSNAHCQHPGPGLDYFSSLLIGLPASSIDSLMLFSFSVLFHVSKLFLKDMNFILSIDKNTTFLVCIFATFKQSRRSYVSTLRLS